MRAASSGTMVDQSALSPKGLPEETGARPCSANWRCLARIRMPMVADSKLAKVTRIRTSARPSSVEVSMGSVTLATMAPPFSHTDQKRSNSAGLLTRRSNFQHKTPSMSPDPNAESMDS